MAPRSFLASNLLLLLLAVASVRAQPSDTAPIRIYPPATFAAPAPLYPGWNVITVSSPSGIREVRVHHSGRYVTRVEGDGAISGCPRSHDIRVFLNTASVSDSVGIEVLDCEGRQAYQTQVLNVPWNLDRNDFGTVETGLRRCRTFEIRLQLGSGSMLLDSITVDDPHVSLRLPVELPTRVSQWRTFTYTVCFRADKPGEYKFPVTTWMRREYPNGGLTTYPVADTGVVRVVNPASPVEPSVESPSELPPEVLSSVVDPTTFRSIAVPNAVLPPAGSIIAGDYDLLGVMGGYAISDNILLQAGGALPMPDDWGVVHGDMTAAWSVGFKVGFPLGDRFDVAGGYQFARSVFDQEITPDVTESRITLHAPYVAVSYGDDHSRLSLTGAYAFKHHQIPTGTFDTTAAILAIGGDREIGRGWKIAGEVAWMQTVDVVPVIATARYFTKQWAVDIGLAYLGLTTGGGNEPNVPIAPVVSFVIRL